MWAVQWLAEQYGAPMNVVAELLGSSETNAYRVVSRWRAAGLVVRKALRPVPGPQWVIPSAETATSLLGFYVQTWIPRPKDARHLELTARTRLALAGREIGEDAWVSERVLRRSDAQRPATFGGQRPHLHDGHWTDDFGRLHAIEVELTRKSSTDARRTVAGAFAEAKKAGAASLIYYTATDEVRNRVQTAAEAVLRRTTSDPEFVVRDLNLLLNPQTEPGKGGLFAAGGAA
jgi:hypothetical protein